MPGSLCLTVLRLSVTLVIICQLAAWATPIFKSIASSSVTEDLVSPTLVPTNANEF